ncbi:DNA-directed RNA polymerase subunit beta [candidate division WWE3 bacterium CG_4_9_14_3_um_filter_41_6]|uniref:DNA-directed RNA polymerase subunit beta n=1 Tax=candidate division WWE3 bacterium CG_4_10_14_0_2_um_filter_41_14 TaxID=1975072 RepID=A0A2M7TK15_UNCKA|nr:MAG: DNA-directed RNA polymerase subunit beta [candidate division WWE3 bacterium CG_4_10_14_0_2_um_filter_41_14]PJA38883.1 MAG: DNA-directed RNA polymerase subunit beta [candidate division WWE3 bacterium CG_4_9_14_3_um_filter_41_6]
MVKKITDRIQIGTASVHSPIAVPNLASVQFESYQWFIEEGLSKVLDEISPIVDYTDENYSLALTKLNVEDPKVTWEDAIEKGLTYGARISAQGTLTNVETGKKTTQDVYLGELPLMTKRGSFIINGTERVIVHQLTRSPGIFFEAEFSNRLHKNLYKAAIRPERGAWIEIETNRNNTFTARINRGRKISATTLLKAFGIKRKDIIEACADLKLSPEEDYIARTLETDVTENQEEAFLEIYGTMRPGDPRILENAADYFYGMFMDPRRFSLSRVGRYHVNKRFKTDFSHDDPKNYLLRHEDLLNTIYNLIVLNQTQGDPDNIDHLSNRRVRSVGELAQQAFRIGFIRLERNIKDRLSIADPTVTLTPNILVNARPIVASMNEFFGSGQLSHYMDQTNPLSELEHLRRVSSLGPGGLTRDRAGIAVRDVQPSHYGRVDAIMTPEGPNIGLNHQLATYARVNEFGFLEAPYRKVEHKGGKAYITDEITYLTADLEEQFKIAEATISTDEKGMITTDRAPVRHKGDFIFAYTKDIDLVDAHPAVMTGVSSGSIPFISSDAGARAQVASNMSKQAVPLITSKAAIVGTGIEPHVIAATGRSVVADNNGTIEYVDGERIEVRAENRNLDVYYLTKFRRTNDNSCYNNTPIVRKGEKVTKGQVLVDGPSSQNGELALGKDLLVAYMPWGGYNYEDSIAISERLVKDDELTSIHIKEYVASVMDTKLGNEEVTRDIPNVSEDTLANLDESGIVTLGAEVKAGDILVGKIAPKGEQELTAEERLLRAIFGEKAREIRDTSLRLPHGDYGTILSITVLDKDHGDELGPGVLKSIKVRVAQKRKISVGDKISGRHFSKGIVAKIVPEEDLPYMEDGTPIDVILNPGSILSRMVIGMIIETHLGWAGKKLGEHYAIPAFDRIDPTLISRKLAEAGLPSDGKVDLFDGRTGEKFKHRVMVGYTNIMKLHHLIDDKAHARSTGPYSLVTQQPLGGKAQMGGQRIGEMEVWALEAYGAAHILQEMLTIKSDDVVGRAKAFEAIIKGLPIPEARLPEAFKLLIKELNSLCLSVEAITKERGGVGIDASRIIESATLADDRPLEEASEQPVDASAEDNIVTEKQTDGDESPNIVEPVISEEKD